MKDIYSLKEINEIRFKRTYANNRLKRFKTKKIEDSLTKQIKIHEIRNITFENSIDAIKNSNIINKNIRINDKIRDEAVRNIVESSNVDDQIFENIITDNNLLILKI